MLKMIARTTYIKVNQYVDVVLKKYCVTQKYYHRKKHKQLCRFIAP